MPFRVQGKYFFLTYPRCTVDPNDLLLHLLEHGPGLPVTIRVARESHADGTPHLHAGIRYANRIDIRTESHFDYAGFHPNIQKCSNWPAVLNYIAKDGDYYDYDGPEHPQDNHRGDRGASDEVTDYAEVAADYTDYGAWLNFALHEKIPFGYAEAFWKDSRRDTSATLLAPANPDEYWEFVGPGLREQAWDETMKSVVVSGPTGIGKTSWCKHVAPKPALFVGHLDALRQFVPMYHRSIIFDDVSFCHLPFQSQIHIADFDNVRQIHMRHRIQQIPPGVYKFFTINPPYRVFLDMPAIARRITCIELT